MVRENLGLPETHTLADRTDLSFWSILRSWLFHWRFVALATMFGAILPIIFATSQAKLFTSASLIEINDNHHHYVRVGKKIIRDKIASPVLETSIADISSHGFLQELIKKNKLLLDPEFSDIENLSESASNSTVVEALAERIRVTRRGGSHVVAIEMTSVDPEKAAHLANMIARLFVEGELKRLGKARKAALAWLEKRTLATRGDLAALEGQALELAAKHGLQYSEDDVAISQIDDIQYVELTQQLAFIKAEGSELKALYQQAVAAGENGIEAAGKLFTEDPALQALRKTKITLETRLTELKGELGDRHPQLLGIRSHINATSQQIGTETIRRVRGMKSELLINHALQEQIQARIDKLKQRRIKKKEVFVRLSNFSSEINTEKIRLSDLNRQIRDIQEKEAIGTDDIKILSLATIPLVHSYPKTGKLIAYGTIIGFLSSLVGVFLRDRWVSDFGFKSLAELSSTKLTPLGIVPELRKRESCGVRLDDHILDRPNSAHAQAFQRIRDRICMICKGGFGEASVVLVTSTSSSEGKTTTAVALARQMCESGYRVLLLDADVRNPQIGNVLGLGAEPGLCELISVGASEHTKILQDPSTDLHVMLSGKSDESVTDLLRSENLEILLNELRQFYDWIFLDSSALGAAGDSLILARHADLAIYVVRWLETTRSKFNNGIEKLREVDGIRLGVTLTRVDMDAADKYVDLDEIRHYGYYGDQSPYRLRQ